MVERRMCPKCRVLRAMRETLTRRKQPAPDGKPQTIVTRTLSCAVCGIFVESDERVEKVPLVKIQGGKDGLGPV